MTEAIVVVNAGSTSLKFAAYQVDGPAALTLIVHGEVDGMKTDPKFVAKDAAGKKLDAHDWGRGQEIDHRIAFKFVITWLEKAIAGVKVVGVGHRVVLGGTRFEVPVLIDPDVLTYLDGLVVMEPSHQPYNVGGARALAEEFPGLKQVACFDTSFHRTMPEVAQIYALPKDVQDAGALHWGYHGISYDYISRQVPNYAPGARRVIAAHLGGGSSMCAMLDGKSIETTMGFGGLTGLPMATRSGDVPADLSLSLSLSLSLVWRRRAGSAGGSSPPPGRRRAARTPPAAAGAAVRQQGAHLGERALILRRASVRHDLRGRSDGPARRHAAPAGTEAGCANLHDAKQ